MINIEQFISRLVQAAYWTDDLSRDFDYQNGFYGLVFRQTNPWVNGLKLYQLDFDYAIWNIDDYNIENYKLALSTALEARENKIISPLFRTKELFSIGRILCFTTLLTTHDGTATFASKCFVDESDVPPIDTWFYLEPQFLSLDRPTLFCWIPKSFENVMQLAIDAEMMGSYKWLDDVVPNFYKQVIDFLNKES